MENSTVIDTELREHQDYTLTPEGYFEFTAQFLKKRKFCCHNNCKNCPYKYTSSIPIH
ncbi:MAG: DUF5522 domain-containing protein [Bacteroidia bacterium]|jgi:hypothetical protein